MSGVSHWLLPQLAEGQFTPRHVARSVGRMQLWRAGCQLFEGLMMVNDWELLK